jgi:hypothetical protein
MEHPMVYIVSPLLDRQHPLGVTGIPDVETLVEIVSAHMLEHGERYCPLFATLPNGIRLERYVALVGEDRLAVKTEFSAIPEEIHIDRISESRYLGRFMASDRLFYDPFGLEVPCNLTAMQRFS